MAVFKNLPKQLKLILVLAVIFALLVSGKSIIHPDNALISLNDITAFNGKDPYVKINGGVPFFEDTYKRDEAFESYSPLDAYGRCGAASACLGKETMPKENEERGEISGVKPSGWQTVKYDVVSGKYLYNRSHLIGWQLSAENANERNLITGTRYFNVEGMLPFENMVADYIKETKNHVIYRVTPIYKSNELLARGVLIEAMSVEDGGAGLCFCVYIYNVQPGLDINYLDGSSKLSG
ncbi:MAG: DNA/RNA non-specific endonuclease [Clostridia bacterium]|nr:DNA/RNA non-specific endonuclease [Clostridia bacterium]